jgi:hypothetical protein
MQTDANTVIRDGLISSPWEWRRPLNMTECECEHMARIPDWDGVHGLDARARAENIALQVVRQFFREKKEISLCAIGQCHGFTELVIHALITKVGKIAHWVLLDDLSEALEFKKHAIGINPSSSVHVRLERLSEKTKLPNDIDFFLIIDGPKWTYVGPIINHYMETATQQTFSLYADRAELILTYGKGREPTRKYTHERTSEIDIRPVYLLYPENETH